MFQQHALRTIRTFQCHSTTTQSQKTTAGTTGRAAGAATGPNCSLDWPPLHALSAATSSAAPSRKSSWFLSPLSQNQVPTRLPWEIRHMRWYQLGGNRVGLACRQVYEPLCGRWCPEYTCASCHGVACCCRRFSRVCMVGLWNFGVFI